jgi:hypothetical protein
MPDILHGLEAWACGPRSFDVLFDDGTRKRVDLTPLPTGPAPEALYALPPLNGD